MLVPVIFDSLEEAFDAARGGDEDAVRVVFRSLHPRLERYLRSRSPAVAQDLAGEVWLAAEQIKGPFGAFLRFTLLTGARRSESAGLRRSELSDGDTTWIIPGERYKNKRDTLIPLSKAAQEIVAAQPRLGDYVFSATGQYPLSDFANRKAEFDKQCGVTGYVLHDLRRTSRTLLSRCADVNADIAERCLGHALSGVRGTYDRHAYEAEKRKAFEALARQIEHIVRRPPAKIADIAAERGKRRS